MLLLSCEKNVICNFFSLCTHIGSQCTHAITKMEIIDRTRYDICKYMPQSLGLPAPIA